MDNDPGLPALQRIVKIWNDRGMLPSYVLDLMHNIIAGCGTHHAVLCPCLFLVITCCASCGVAEGLQESPPDSAPHAIDDPGARGGATAATSVGELAAIVAPCGAPQWCVVPSVTPLPPPLPPPPPPPPPPPHSALGVSNTAAARLSGLDVSRVQKATENAQVIRGGGAVPANMRTWAAPGACCAWCLGDPSCETAGKLNLDNLKATLAAHKRNLIQEVCLPR